MKKSERYFEDRLPSDFYERLEKGEFNRNIYPEFSDRKAWENARKSEIADIIIQAAEEIKAGSVPALLISQYRQFIENGNRTGYEALYFERRKNLAYLALAMCLTGDKEKYMSRLLDYTIAIMEEWIWTLPAHVYWYMKSEYSWRVCDLFAAETGSVLALLYTILGKELDEVFPGIAEKLRKQVLERTVYTVLDKKNFHRWDIAEKPANWTPWCSHNCLSVALLLEKNNKKLVAEVKHFLRNISRFVYYYADDGYCPEGVSYYGKANLMVFYSMMLLEQTVPGSMDSLFREEKLKKMLEFISNIRIGEDNVVTFGDCQPGLFPDLSMILPAGKYFKSKSLLELGAIKGRLTGLCGDHLKMSLALLFDSPEEIPGEMSVGEPETLFKDRLMIYRSAGLSVSLKAGHNNEPHNHNDLGHFELFSGNVPVILDSGTGEYAQINFSEHRYTLWYTRGSGHNAPVFGEYEQLSGAEYTAAFTVDGKRSCCDLSNAYPKEAGVKKFDRVIEFSEKKVVVEDSFKLKKKLPAEITLLSICKPVAGDDKTIQLGDVKLELDGIVLTAIETVPEMFRMVRGERRNIWGGTVYALKLKSEAERYKLNFHC